MTVALVVCSGCGSSGQGGSSELANAGTGYKVELPVPDDVRASTGLASPVCVKGTGGPVRLLKLVPLDRSSKIRISDFAIAPQNYEDAWVDLPLRQTEAASARKIVTKKCADKSQRTSFLIVEFRRKALTASIDKLVLTYASGGHRKSLTVPFGVFLCPRAQYDTPKCQFK